jgi:hypothetical protein
MPLTFAVLAGESFARLALRMLAEGIPALQIRCVDLEFVPMRANRKDWPRAAIASGEGTSSTCRRHRAGFPRAALFWRASGASATWRPSELG